MLYSMKSGLGQFVRLYYSLYRGDRLMHIKKDTVYLFKEETEKNLSRLELFSQDAFACQIVVAQASARFINEDSGQKK